MRRRRFSPTRPCIAACTLLFAIAGCGDGGAQRDAGAMPPVAPVDGGTAVIVAGTAPDFLNPLISRDRYTQELLRYALFVPLIRYDSALGYAPALARSWEMLGDTGVIFHLRDDVHWHDGRLTTAYDVAFTFDRIKDPATGFPNPGFFQHWKRAVVEDSFDIRFSFDPHLDALAGLPFTPPVPRHVLDTVPASRMRQAALNRQPVGNGPFRLVKAEPGQQWVFEANREYPSGLGGRPHLDRLVWRQVPNPVAELAELRAGTADLALNVRADAFAAAVADSGLTPIVRASREFAFIGWNGARPPFDDARVRRALVIALDRASMIRVLRAGHGSVAVGPIGPFHWAHADTLPPLPYSPDSARALLRAAGYFDRDGDGALDGPDGQPFSFELKLPAQQAYDRDVAQLIRADLAAIGVGVEMRPTDYATLVNDMTSPRRNFDAALMGWASDVRVNLSDQFHSAARGTPLQFADYANPEVDRILDATERMPARAAAKPLLIRLQRILRDDEPWGFLYYYPDLYVARSRLRGAAMDIRGALVNLRTWWVAPAAARRPEGSG